MQTRRAARLVAAGLMASVAGAAFAADFRLRTPDMSDELHDRLEDASLAREQTDERDGTAQDIIAAAQADYARLLGVLYDDGYFGGTISIKIDGQEAATIPTVGGPASVGLVVAEVSTGPRFRFGRTDIAPLAPRTDLPDSFARGERARTGAIRDAVDASVEGWRDVGMAKAEAAGQDITADHRNSTLDVSVRMAPGPRLRFGNLIVEGNEDVRTERVRAIAGLPTGEIFSPDELEAAQKRLRRTGAFDGVNLTEADAAGPGNTLDITAQVSEEKPRRFGFGAEFSTQEGLGVSAFWLHRNLLGGAERLRVEGEVTGIGGGTDYRAGLRFERPATFGSLTDFYASADIEHLEEPTYTSDQVSLEAGINRIVSDDLEYSAGLGLRSARVDDDFGTRDYTILTFPLEATYDRRDDRLDPKSGYYVNAEATPFAAVSGTSSGARLYLDGRAYRSVGAEDRLTFALRGQIGALAGPEIEKAPADYLFYSGGGGTVRGQPYQSLSIDLGDDREAGGRAFAGLSAELRGRVRENISLVGFYDVGFIGRDPGFSGDGETHSGAGFGVRYFTPVGPIRVDVGFPVSGPDDNSGVQVYIGIGQAF